MDINTSPRVIISYVTEGLCMLLVSICVGLRLYARQHGWRSMGREECA
jgi:hypothetical protein